MASDAFIELSVLLPYLTEVKYFLSPFLTLAASYHESIVHVGFLKPL